MQPTSENKNNINPKISFHKSWFALYTKPRHEFKAKEYLDNIELESYLPTITTVRKWSDRKKKVTEPLFKGYIFVNCNELERHEALQHEAIINTVCFNGQPAKIPDWQIENLQKMLSENHSVIVGEMLSEGTKVKIVDGPFAGVEGMICQTDDKGRVFGITIDLLRRSVIVRLPKESIVKEITQS